MPTAFIPCRLKMHVSSLGLEICFYFAGQCNLLSFQTWLSVSSHLIPVTVRISLRPAGTMTRRNNSVRHSPTAAAAAMPTTLTMRRGVR